MSANDLGGRLVRHRESPWRQRFIDAGIIKPNARRRTISEKLGEPCLKLDDAGRAEAVRQIADYDANGPAWDLFVTRHEESEEPCD